MAEARENGGGAAASGGGPQGASSQERAAAQFELLGFLLGDEEYAIDVLEVKEIIRLQPVTAVPRSPGCIRGIVTLRGVIVPVYDLHRRLGLAPAEPGPDARIVVAYRGEELAGLLVDRITQVVRVPADRVEPPPQTIGPAEAECLRGVARLEDRLLILLDLPRVLEVAP
jgi:purine-binding chemotaxis protein CheW